MTTITPIDALQSANLPRCDWRDLFTMTDSELSADETAQLDEYFRIFLAPGPCVACGKAPNTDLLSAALFPSFQWGLAHGEGHCTTPGCRYPARALHYNIGPIKRMNLVLQYHPSELRETPQEVEETP